MKWNRTNRRITYAFVMLSLFCSTLTIVSPLNLWWTALVFLVLAGITDWYAKLTKGVN